MKKLLLVFTAVVLGVSITGCTTTAKKSKVDIGIVLPTKEEPRWVQDEERFKAALKDSDYSVEILFSNGSSATEKTNVETLLAKGIKVLIIAPQDGAAAASAVEAAQKAGVKVISYDRLVTQTSAVDYYITFDSKSVGKAQAQYLVDQAGDKLVDGAKLPLFLYAGAATDNNAFLFFEGALDVLKPFIKSGAFEVQNYSGTTDLTKDVVSHDELAEVIGKITTNWDFNVAKNLAESNLTTYKGAGDTFILAPNDGTARSIADVFAANKGITSYKVTGQDAEKASVQYIIDGKQSMTVFKDVRNLVKGSIEMAKTLLEGKSITTNGSYNNGKTDVKAVQVNVDVVTSENVKSILVDSGYYQASEFENLK